MSTTNKNFILSTISIVSMLLVTLHHSLIGGYNYPAIVFKIDNFITIPALFSFFFVSGILSISYEKHGFLSYLSKKAIRLLIPFVSLQLIFFPIKLLVGYLTNNVQPFSFIQFALAFICPRSDGVLPHLWFCLALFIISLSTPLLSLLSRSKTSFLVFPILLGLVVVSLFNFNVSNYFCLSEVLFYLSSYVFGFVCSKYGIFERLMNLKRINVISILSFFIFVSLAVLNALFNKTFSIVYLNGVLGFGAIVSIAFIIGNHELLFHKFFDKKTFIIYLLSLCAQNLIEILIVKVSIHWSLTIVIMFMVGIAIPLIIYWLVTILNRNNKIPHFLLAIIGM